MRYGKTRKNSVLLVSMWKETVIAYFMAYPITFMEGLRKTMKNIIFYTLKVA
jgi:hypothetical protein